MKYIIFVNLNSLGPLRKKGPQKVISQIHNGLKKIYQKEQKILGPSTTFY